MLGYAFCTEITIRFFGHGSVGRRTLGGRTSFGTNQRGFHYSVIGFIVQETTIEGRPCGIGEFVKRFQGFIP